MQNDNWALCMAGRRAESLSQRVSRGELLQVVSSLSETASWTASSTLR